MNKLKELLKNKTYVRTLYIVLAVILLAGGSYVYLSKTDRVSVENSVVEAPLVSLTPDVAGRLNSISVTEGQEVTKGDAIAVVGSNVVRAYSDGKIISVNRSIGNMVSPQVAVAQMVNSNEMRINGTIDETKGLNRVKAGQIVSFTVDALPGKVFWGYVDEVSESAKQTQVSFSISSTRPTQQFNVYANFDSAKYPEIKNGMSAKMTVYTK